MVNKDRSHNAMVFKSLLALARTLRGASWVGCTAAIYDPDAEGETREGRDYLESPTLVSPALMLACDDFDDACSGAEWGVHYRRATAEGGYEWKGLDSYTVPWFASDADLAARLEQIVEQVRANGKPDFDWGIVYTGTISIDGSHDCDLCA